MAMERKSTSRVAVAEVYDEADLAVNRLDPQVKQASLKFLAKCARALDLNCFALATAARLFHEFFLATRHAKSYDTHLVVLTCIQLAAKIEEQPNVRIRDVINVAHRIAFPNVAPLEYGSELEKVRDSIACCELLVCRTLKFHVRYTHAYVYMAHYLASVFDWSNETDAAKRYATDVSFALANDSLLTELCLTESAPRIAIAAMHCAFALTNFRFPASDANWWAFFEPTLTDTELHELASRILEVYIAESAGDEKGSDSDSETETRMMKWLVEGSDNEGEAVTEIPGEHVGTKRKRRSTEACEKPEKRERHGSSAKSGRGTPEHLETACLNSSSVPTGNTVATSASPGDDTLKTSDAVVS